MSGARFLLLFIGDDDEPAGWLRLVDGVVVARGADVGEVERDEIGLTHLRSSRAASSLSRWQVEGCLDDGSRLRSNLCSTRTGQSKII